MRGLSAPHSSSHLRRKGGLYAPHCTLFVGEREASMRLIVPLRTLRYTRICLPSPLGTPCICLPSLLCTAPRVPHPCTAPRVPHPCTAPRVPHPCTAPVYSTRVQHPVYTSLYTPGSIPPCICTSLYTRVGILPVYHAQYCTVCTPQDRISIRPDDTSVRVINTGRE